MPKRDPRNRRVPPSTSLGARSLGLAAALALVLSPAASGVAGAWGTGGQGKAPQAQQAGKAGSGSSKLQKAIQAGLASGGKLKGKADLGGFSPFPTSFEQNAGQMDPEILFAARRPGYNLLLTSSEIVMAPLPADQQVGQKAAGKKRSQGPSGKGQSKETDKTSTPATAQEKAEKPTLGESRTVSPQTPPEPTRLRFEGASPSSPVGIGELGAKMNYFMGKDASSWHTGVSSFTKVRYKNLYPGIDLIVYTSKRGAIEYDFVVSPGADPSKILLTQSGPGKMSLTSSGSLAITTPSGTMRQKKPFAYQSISGRRKEVSARFSLRGRTAQLDLGNYDRAKPVVIDPILDYFSMFGEPNSVWIDALGRDAEGKVVIAGQTRGCQIPYIARNHDPRFLEPASPPSPGTATVPPDSFVAKFDLDTDGDGSGTPDPATNRGLVWASCFNLGVIGDNFVNAKAGVRSALVDKGTGNVYLAGTTEGLLPGTSNAFEAGKSYGGGGDDFFMALNPQGSQIIYSAYLGGSGYEGKSPLTNDYPAMAIDDTGRAYVVGLTGSTGKAAKPFPTIQGSFQPDPVVAQTGRGPADPVVAQTGSGAGNCRGDTRDLNSFLVRINPNKVGNDSLEYSTFLWHGTDAGGVAVRGGHVYVTGASYGGLETTQGAFQTSDPVSTVPSPADNPV